MKEVENTGEKYSRGKIYKIISSNTDDVYIGSSCEPYLSNRLAKHVSNYNNYLKGKHHYTTAYKVLEKGNYQIIWLEDCSCERRDQLVARERWYIENTPNCINKVIVGRTYTEYYHDNKTKITDRCKLYYENNKEIVNKRNKLYRESNKDKVTTIKKAYRENNKDVIKVKQKEYRDINKDKINAWKSSKIECECGCTITLNNKANHKKSAKHIKALEQKNKV